MESTREFLRTNNFQTERHSRLAWPLIEAGFGVSDVLSVLCRRGEWLPTIILSDQAATESRRLVASILVTMLNMAPSEVRRLGSTHITVSAQGKIQLNIPPSLLNSRRKHSPDILPSELEADEWVHAEIRRYIEQSRPILVGAGKDGGYFLTTGGGIRHLGSSTFVWSARRTRAFRTKKSLSFAGPPLPLSKKCTKTSLQ
jgi:hypothetical protein